MEVEQINDKKYLNIFKLNKVIWLLTLSDVFTAGLFLPLSPLIGLYLSRQLSVDTVQMVGIGVGIYYFARSLSQIPIGILVDKIKRDNDDLMILIAGNIFMGFPFLLFPMIQNQNTFFFLQLIIGLGTSMNLVTWRKLFAKNLDAGKEGTSFAIYETIFSGSIALFSLIIGVVANINKSYFDFIMIAVGILMLLSVIWPISIFFVKNRKSKGEMF